MSQAPTLTPRPPAGTIVRPRRQSTAAWPLLDRLGYWLCWAAGVALCLIVAGIVVFMLVKGIAYLRPALFFEHPAASLHQNASGGFLDPIVGTLIITALGTLSRLQPGSRWRCGYPSTVARRHWHGRSNRPST